MGVRKYEFNYHFFQNINTKEKAYWLGFFYADGYITSQGAFGCGLAEKDKHHLEKFLSDINCSSFECLQYCEDSHSWRFNLFSKELYDDLLKLGFTTNKSYDQTTTAFDATPDELKPDFIRGFWDGDGYISVSKENKNLSGVISNNEILLQAFCNYINNHFHDVDFCKVTKTDGYPRIRIYTTKVNDFCDWIYKNKTPVLDRKYEAYLNLKKPFYKQFNYKHIRKLPSNRYYIRIPHNGKNETVGTFDTVKEAIEAFNIKAIEYNVPLQVYKGEELKKES